MAQPFDTVLAMIGGTSNAESHDASGSEKSRLAHANNGASVLRSIQHPIRTAIRSASETTAVHMTDSRNVKSKYKQAAMHDGMTSAHNIDVTHTMTSATA
ncbi:MAG: hypothetical protein QOF21_1897 [Actinomycetota bacterium]|jgi:hypothetical protein